MEDFASYTAALPLDDRALRRFWFGEHKTPNTGFISMRRYSTVLVRLAFHTAFSRRRVVHRFLVIYSERGTIEHDFHQRW